MFISTILPLLFLPLSTQSDLCYCSGLTENCTRSDLFWTREVFRPSQDSPGFAITDRDPGTWLGSNKPWYDPQTREVKYTFNPGDGTTFYWSLPPVFLANKLSSYGGNLTVSQDGEGRGQRLRGSVAILSGNQVTLHYNPPQSGPSILLTERDWLREEGGRLRPATREDMLRALSDLRIIHVRASTRQWMREIRVREAGMDVTTPEETDRPHEEGGEECDCPAEYSGSSCESCAPGHYSHSEDFSCRECPCNQHQETCHQDQTGEVVCVCSRGWVGQFCETRPIDVKIAGPPVQTVRPGQTVKFDCSAKPKIKIEKPMEYKWSKDSGNLPAGRSSDSGLGILIIKSVEVDDSGTYVCTVTAGQQSE